MKKRVVSAIVMLLIFVPLLIIGGTIFNIGLVLISLMGLYEFLKVKENKKELPLFIKIISYVFFLLMIMVNVTNKDYALKMDYCIISGLFLTFLVPTILYHDDKKYSINDAFYLVGGIFFLSLSFSLLSYMRGKSINLFIYLLLITIITDTFAYITGRLIGKNKLIEVISPNKTWEGTIGGTLFGVFISTVFYVTVINPNINIFLIIFISLFLSIVGQFGDLFFSAIKRYYGTKDFSNLIPGHGGILDRLDSIIFVVLGAMFFITIL